MVFVFDPILSIEQHHRSNLFDSTHDLPSTAAHQVNTPLAKYCETTAIALAQPHKRRTSNQQQRPHVLPYPHTHTCTAGTLPV